MAVWGKAQELANFIVPVEAVGTRVDVFLSACEALGLTRSGVQRLLGNGDVLCGGKVVEKNYRVAAGDVLCVNLPAAVASDILAEDIPLDVVYEDEDLIVVNKPRGLVVHPAAGHFCGTLVNALLHHCRGQLSGIGGVERPGIVHRLDKDTSGLMVVAKNDASHVSLSEQLAARTMTRVYHAWCLGDVREDIFTVNAPIGRHPRDRQKMAVVAGGRAAVTHFTVLRRLADGGRRARLTLAEARLETGRTHQIRVHMAYVGHPVWGDAVYAPEKQVKVGGFVPDAQMLHARRLLFVHPRTGQEMAFEAEADWKGMFDDA